MRNAESMQEPEVQKIPDIDFLRLLQKKEANADFRLQMTLLEMGKD